MAPRPDLICIPNGVFQENCYILADRDAGACVIIDPGEETGVFLDRLGTEGLTPSAIWLTHAHVDHIMGVRAVAEATGVQEIRLHQLDLPLYRAVAEQARWLGIAVQKQPEPTHAFEAGQTIRLGRFAFEVRHVPGHSPGSIALAGEGMVIAGDALFRGSIGRTDLPGGDYSTLIHSLQTQLLTLSDDTVVHPGHGPPTTIGEERAGNPFLLRPHAYA